MYGRKRINKGSQNFKILCKNQEPHQIFKKINNLQFYSKIK